jgi:hypothetical protein
MEAPAHTRGVRSGDHSSNDTRSVPVDVHSGSLIFDHHHRGQQRGRASRKGENA